jgi:hypothetical protein
MLHAETCQFLVPKIPEPEQQRRRKPSQAKPRPPRPSSPPAFLVPLADRSPRFRPGGSASRRDGMKSPLRRFRGFGHHHRERKDHAPPPAKLDELVHAVQVSASARFSFLLILPSAGARLRAKNGSRVLVGEPRLCRVRGFRGPCGPR